MGTMTALHLVLLAASADRPALHVAPFEAEGVEPSIAQTFTRVLAVELAGAGAEVITGNDVAAVLAAVRQKHLMGGDDGLAALDALAGVQRVLSGAIGGVGQSLVVTAQILDVSRGEVVNRVTRVFPDREQLTSGAAVLARELLSTPATLTLYNQVPGARLFVDDRAVGTMPLPPLRLARSGTYRLRAEGPDHLPYETEITVEAGKAHRLRLEMVSLEELQAHAKARARWGLAILSTGALAAAGSAFLFREAAGIQREYEALDAMLTSDETFEHLSRRGRSTYAAAYGVAAIAAAALAGGAWLWLTDPYGDQMRSAQLAVSIHVQGGYAALSARF